MQLTNVSPEIIEKISQWYWDFGSRRAGAYVLSRGSWLDKILRTLRGYSDIRHSEDYFKRPSVAVWGPSQSGKSTLLASFIDYGEGALNWDGSNFKFVSKDSKNRFNPNNRGSDASGCVTRYVMRESVEYPEAPIEVCFVEERDILMSLAFGYLSEMEGKDRDGERKYFDEESLRQLLECISKETESEEKPNKEYFSLLVAVVDVIEALINAKQERYSNLAPKWEMSRREILNCDALLVSKDAVLNFAAEVFWDGWGSLTDICKKLIAKRAEIRSKYENKRFFCSLKFASILLDIASAEKRDVLNSLSGFGEKALGADVAFVDNAQSSVFSDAMDFALMQALVAVLVVPLKKSVIKVSNLALCELLETADLVDFPGVANQAKGIEEARLNDETVSASPILGLTKVLKRGKTASIVIGYSRNLNIDVFAILMRMNKYPSKPEQLNAGIASWFDAMLQKPFNDFTAAELPINIVQTFASELVNSVTQREIEKDGLKEIFEKNEGFGALCKPRNAKYFAINYPAFKPDCDFDVSSTAELKEIVSQIENDQVFVNYYSRTKESLRHMCGLEGPGGDDGGRTFLFESLLKQVKASIRNELLTRKKLSLEKTFNITAEEALPTKGNEESRRREDIQKISDGINARVSWDCERISRAILEFVNIRPEALKALPPDVESKSQDSDKVIHRYCEDVIDTVKTSLMQSCLGSAIGLDDDSTRGRIISYFMENLNSMKLKKWIRENLSTLSGADGGRMAARRPLALYLSALLLRRSDNEPHRRVEDVQKYLRETRAAVDGGDYRSHPGYTAVVVPFLTKTLTALAKESATARGYQEGDNELRAIFNELD